MEDKKTVKNRGAICTQKRQRWKPCGVTEECAVLGAQFLPSPQPRKPSDLGSEQIEIQSITCREIQYNKRILSSYYISGTSVVARNIKSGKIWLCSRETHS